MQKFPDPHKIEFLDCNKLLIESVRQVKTLCTAIDSHLPNLRYLTLQQSKLPLNFIKQFRVFLDGNDSLIRLSMIMNQMAEDEVFEIVESTLEHPNLEVL